SMVEKGANLAQGQRAREPLHVILHEHLLRRAFDRTCAFDRSMDPAANGHVCAQKDFGGRIADWGTTRHGVRQFFQSEIRIPHSAIFKSSLAATSDDSDFLRPCTR